MTEESIRWPSPRLIDDEERKQLERIFHKVYAKGRAAITADDIAGGDFPDRQTQIMTLVDSRLARHVFGDKKIDWPTFLEHMCEMGCQGHPSAWFSVPYSALGQLHVWRKLGLW